MPLSIVSPFQRSLLSWFGRHARPLPWRKHYRPYEVWVSEIMLQQTQVETALPYFDRWMKAFPTLESLASAQEEKVMKLWQGLGYYSRARNLHETARRILTDHQGKFPSDYDTILSLKGIGRYTAGAIASIAFNQERPIVDWNVLRVLTRIYAIKKPIDVLKNKEEFWALQEKLIPKGRARFFNQALMELGALVCAPQNPLCGECPIQAHCAAFKQNAVHRFPIRAGRQKSVKVEAAALILKKDGKVLIQKRPLGEIMGGLWEFPEWKLAKDKTLSLEQIQKKAAAEIRKEFGPQIKNPEMAGTIKRNYTHHLEFLHVFSAEVSKNFKTKPKKDWPRAWTSLREFDQYPFSSAHAKICKLIMTSQPSSRYA